MLNALNIEIYFNFHKHSYEREFEWCLEWTILISIVKPHWIWMIV